LGVSLLLIVLSFTTLSISAQDKMNVEDLIARHLESVGTDKLRLTIKSRLVLGTCSVTFREGKVNNGEGRAVLASDSRRHLIGMVFGFPEYPHEKMGFDGKNLSISYLKPGVRSSLGNFVRMNEVIFRDGLFGGVLSAAFPLFDLFTRQAKLEYAGLKKIDGKSLYALKYYPQKGADVKVTLYFDDESFRHVRTEYEQVIVSRQGGTAATTLPQGGGSQADGSASQLETRYKLVEEFSNFKEESGLTLPHTYKISFSFDSGRGSIRNIWLLNLTQFGFNQQFDEGAFDVNRATS
jgi:hypothetical protein